jgi:hypothetical protein
MGGLLDLTNDVNATLKNGRFWLTIQVNSLKLVKELSPALLSFQVI